MNIQERTFLMVKAGGVQCGLMGEMVELHVSKQGTPQSALHRAVHQTLLPYPNPIHDLCTCRRHGLRRQRCRRMVGEINAQGSARGTIHCDFALDIGVNVVQASDSVNRANRKIRLWYKREELVDYTPFVDD
ncbi:hypothetical protein ACTXT7_010819 [Hymenolepis weldensis]